MPYLGAAAAPTPQLYATTNHRHRMAAIIHDAQPATSRAQHWMTACRDLSTPSDPAPSQRISPLFKLCMAWAKLLLASLGLSSGHCLPSAPAWRSPRYMKLASVIMAGLSPLNCAYRPPASIPPWINKLEAIAHCHLVALARLLHLLENVGRFLTKLHHCAFYR